MEIKITGSLQKIGKLLDAIEGSKEQSSYKKLMNDLFKTNYDCLDKALQSLSSFRQGVSETEDEYGQTKNQSNR